MVEPKRLVELCGKGVDHFGVFRVVAPELRDWVRRECVSWGMGMEWEWEWEWEWECEWEWEWE